MQTARDPSHSPPASIPSAQHAAAPLPHDCHKAQALVHHRGFLGRARLVLVVTVDRRQGWEHVMDAICVLLVRPSWAGVTCAAPCPHWAWGFPPCRRCLGYEPMWRDYMAQRDTLFSAVPLGRQPGISLMPVHLVQGTHLRLKIAFSLKRNDITKGNGFNKRGFFFFIFFLGAAKG